MLDIAQLCANDGCTNNAAKGRTVCNSCKTKARRAKVAPVAEAICQLASCNLPFTPTRKTQKFCSDACQNRSYNAERSEEANTQDINEAFASASDFARNYYNMHHDLREQYILDIIAGGLQGNNRIIRALTAPALIKPDRDRKGLFYKKCPQSYKTIAEIVNSYCIDCFGYSFAQLRKDKNVDLSVCGYDMRQFDERGAYREMIANIGKEPNSLYPNTKFEKMEGRKIWVIDMYYDVLGSAL